MINIRKYLFAFLFFIVFSPNIYAQGDNIDAINFKLRNLQGKRVELKKLLEKGPVLLDFWALWCVPCMKELPHIQDIWEEYKDKGLSVIAVNEDSPSDQSKVKPFVRQKRFKFEVIIDENKDIWNKFRINILPTAILLDMDGSVVYSHTAYKPGDEKNLIAAVDKLFLGTHRNK